MQYTLFSQLTDDSDIMDVAMYYVDEDEKEVPHPLKTDLREGGVVLEFEVLDRWRDDHEDCMAVRVKTAKENYVISYWWIDALECYKSHNNALNSVDGSRKLLQDWFIEYGEEI